MWKVKSLGRRVAGRLQSVWSGSRMLGALGVPWMDKDGWLGVEILIFFIYQGVLHPG